MDTVEMDQIIAEEEKMSISDSFFSAWGRIFPGSGKQICLLKCRQRPTQ